MNRRSIAAACTLSVVIALAAGCGDRDAAESKAMVRKTPVTTAQAVRQRVDAVETTVGRIEATAAPALAAETAGRLVRLHVDGGSVVKKGQVLAELDGEPQRLAVASARASVERLEALLANQQRTVKRYQELRSKAVSESMLEEAIAQLQAFRERIAEAMLDAAGVPLQLTVSIGVQAVRPTAVDTPEKLLQAADAALYVAKAEGRNRLVRAPRG